MDTKLKTLAGTYQVSGEFLYRPEDGLTLLLKKRKKLAANKTPNYLLLKLSNAVKYVSGLMKIGANAFALDFAGTYYRIEFEDGKATIYENSKNVTA
jgi:hypothetical protein